MKTALFAAALLCAAPLHAQDRPSKPVRIIVPFAAGGTADIAGRVVAGELSKAFPQPFIVENKAGASGNIGAADVARSTDGHTLLMGNTPTIVINQFVFATMPYNPAKDFAPVSQVLRVPNVLVVTPSLGVRTLEELIALAKAQPGSIHYGHSGTGTVLHLSGELLKQMAQIDLVPVPYKGSAPMVQDLLGGQLQMTIDNVPTVLAHVRSGKLVALGVTTAKPLAALPEVPPIARRIPGYETVAFFALMAPAATPQRVIARVAAETERLLRRPEVAERFTQLGVDPVSSTPSELAAFIASETAKWREVVRAAGVKPE